MSEFDTFDDHKEDSFVRWVQMPLELAKLLKEGSRHMLDCPTADARGRPLWVDSVRSPALGAAVQPEPDRTAAVGVGREQVVAAISGRSPCALNFSRDKVLDDSFAAMGPDRSQARLGHKRP